MAEERRISIIVAMARNRVIGINNTLPWHLPEDLRHFKALTMGHTIIMGRKTYESIGRPLPGRTTVIVSRDPGYRVAGCQTVGSIPEALALSAEDPEVFIVGGANVYSQVLGHAHRLYITEIQAEYRGDAYFPEIEPGHWREVARDCRQTSDGLDYCFRTLDRVTDPHTSNP